MLLTLPDELIDNVLSFLGGADLSASAVACTTLSSRAPALYERLIAQAPSGHAIDAAAWRENGYRTVRVHNYGASYTGLTYFDLIWRYAHWRKRAGLGGWSKPTADKIKTRHTGDVCPVLHSWRPFGQGHHAMWPGHQEPESHIHENCVDLLGLDTDYVPIGRRGCSTVFVCAPYQTNPLVEAILRKHALNVCAASSELSRRLPDATAATRDAPRASCCPSRGCPRRFRSSCVSAVKQCRNYWFYSSEQAP